MLELFHDTECENPVFVSYNKPAKFCGELFPKDPVLVSGDAVTFLFTANEEKKNEGEKNLNLLVFSEFYVGFR